MPQIIKQDYVELDGMPSQSMIPDGFAYNGYLRGGLPFRYREDAVAAISWIRDSAGAWFPRWYATPNNYASTVAAWDTYAEQHRMVPGGVIFGWNLAVISGTVTNLFFQIVDPCSRHSIFQTFVGGNMLRNPTAIRRPFILQSPYQVTTQGLIDVQIRNNSNAAVQVQLVLHVAEPANVETSARVSSTGSHITAPTPR